MNLLNKFNFMYYDGVEPQQLSFQDVASPIAEQLVFFHDNIMFIIIVILVLVGWIMVSAMINKHYYRYLVEGTTIEIV